MSCVFLTTSNVNSKDISRFLSSNVNPYITTITGISIILGLLLSFFVFLKKLIVSTNLKNLRLYKYNLDELKIDKDKFHSNIKFGMKRLWNVFKKDKYREDFLKIFDLELDINKKSDTREILLHEVSIWKNIRLFILLRIMNTLLSNSLKLIDSPTKNSYINFRNFIDGCYFIKNNCKDIFLDIVNENSVYDFELKIELDFFYIDFFKIVFLKEKYCKFNLWFIPFYSKQENLRKTRKQFVYRGNVYMRKRKDLENNANDGYHMCYEPSKYRRKGAIDFTREINNDKRWNRNPNDQRENFRDFLKEGLEKSEPTHCNFDKVEILYYFACKAIVLYSFGLFPSLINSWLWWNAL